METDALFQKAFNAGYLIEKHLPELSKLLVNSIQDKTNPYVEGFVAGCGEMEVERLRSNPKLLEKLRGEARDTPSTNTKDRDNKDMDIER